MVKARTWFALFMVSVGTIAATASCGSDEATGGSGGGSIITGGGIGGRTGSVGRAGTGGGGGVSTSGSLLGVECTADSQCGEGLICIKANSTLLGDGGPSHGMCTKSCDTNALTNTECDTVKPGAGCVNFGTENDPVGFCLDGCELGEVADVTSKCAGRTDFVCVDLGQSVSMPFCVPHCRSDAECGTGLFCDKSDLLGLCKKTKVTGDPVGTACTPGATTTTCEGYCIRTSETGVTPVTGECVELCSGGSECMYGSGSNPSPGGFCGGQLSDTFGPIDLAYCLPNCSCTSDCQLDGDLCRKWPDRDAALAEALGAPGICYPLLSMSTELSCGEGGAGGAGGASAGGAGGDGPEMPPEVAGASGSGT